MYAIHGSCMTLIQNRGTQPLCCWYSAAAEFTWSWCTWSRPCALRHGVFSQLSGQQQADSGLDLPGGDSAALVVVSQTRGLTGDALKDVAHEAVHDAHSFGGDAGVGVDLLHHLVDVDGVALLPGLSPLLACLADSRPGSLAGLLQSHDGGALEAQVGLEVLSDLPHQALEGQLADQQLGGLLVAADLPQSHGTGPVTVRLLHAAGAGALLRAALVASCFLGAFPPVDLRAVCLVLAMISLSPEAVQGAALPLQSVHHIHGGHSLPLSVLGVGDGITDHVLQEHLQHTAGLLVDQTGDMLHSAAASQTADGGLGDALDVITEHFTVAFSASFADFLGGCCLLGGRCLRGCCLLGRHLLLRALCDLLHGGFLGRSSRLLRLLGCYCLLGGWLLSGGFLRCCCRLLGFGCGLLRYLLGLYGGLGCLEGAAGSGSLDLHKGSILHQLLHGAFHLVGVVDAFNGKLLLQGDIGNPFTLLGGGDGFQHEISGAGACLLRLGGCLPRGLGRCGGSGFCHVVFKVDSLDLLKRKHKVAVFRQLMCEPH
ncbi:hypothetical protein F7725_011002 [Dissostichus mawsoni]|uniref:Uncharacterized protein n=1 Tax=Dissostichus mawsoni TaxID=36200 RepID=A0A7J5Z9F0_DISMA|nr:hypothetical protein F7725_011002 [Dissostichus mawsoni]